jgi:hypothetical protein
MSDLEIEVSLGRIRAIPAVNPASGSILLAGPGELMGWSFRESGAEAGLSTEASLVAPAAGATIASIANVPVGVYSISWEVQLIGAAAAADADNFQLFSGATLLMTSLNAGAAGQYPQTPVQFNLTSQQTIAVKALGAGTAGVTYAVQLSVVPVTTGQAILELQDGNNPMCEITAGTAGLLTAWFGPEGIRFYNQIKAVPIVGQMSGAIFARFGRAHGYT